MTLEAEEYLGERERKKRRLWTKLRAGCLELRVETGRWEWLTVDRGRDAEDGAAVGKAVPAMLFGGGGRRTCATTMFCIRPPEDAVPSRGWVDRRSGSVRADSAHTPDKLTAGRTQIFSVTFRM